MADDELIVCPCGWSTECKGCFEEHKRKCKAGQLKLHLGETR